MKVKRFNIVLLVIISFVIFYLMLKDDLSGVLLHITRVNLGWLFIALVLVFLYWLFQAVSLWMVSKTVDSKFSFKEVFMTIIIGNFFSTITPFAAGGHIYQIYYFNKRNLRVETSTNIVVNNFITYQIAFVIASTIAVGLNAIFDFFPKDHFLKNLVVLGFAINIFLIIFLFLVSYGKKSSSIIIKFVIKILGKLRIIKDKEKATNKATDSINHFYQGALSLRRHKKVFLKAVICNFLSLCLFFTIPFVVAYSLGIFHKLDLLTAMVSSAYIMLLGTFIPTPGAVGGIEYGFITFIGIFMKGAPLMAMLLLWRLVTYYLGMFIGGVVLLLIKERRI